MEGGTKKGFSNTTSTMYVDSTISKPNAVALIKSVATIIHSQMQEDQDNLKQIEEDSDLFFFSEEKYIKEKPEEFDDNRKNLLREMPTVESIAEFINALYECGQFSTEWWIICLVYINRFISFTEMPLKPTTWRPLCLCSILVAQKVWDDSYLSNADFAFIYPFFTNDEVNKLERKFLELIEYNVTVKSSVYARYYFELRSLSKTEDDFPLKQLTAEKGSELEASSKKKVGDLKDKTKMSMTYNEKEITSKAKYILS